MVHFGDCSKAVEGGGFVEGEAIICRSSRQLTEADSGKEVAFFCLSSATCRLPPSGQAGRGYNIMIYNVGRGDLTLAPGNGETVGDSAALVLARGQWCWMRTNESGWKIISGFYNPGRSQRTPSVSPENQGLGEGGKPCPEILFKSLHIAPGRV